MNKVIYKVIFLLFLISGCSSPSKLTTWKAQNKPPRLNKILVIGVAHDSLRSVKQNMEACFVSTLKNNGHDAVTSIETFGHTSLAQMARERTYLLLCKQGIDAVIFIALLNEEKADKFHISHTEKYSSSYFYKRIQNYRLMIAEPSYAGQVAASASDLLWEATIFNLSTLSPSYWAQTKAFTATTVKLYDSYCKLILNNMSKHKIIR